MVEQDEQRLLAQKKCLAKGIYVTPQMTLDKVMPLFEGGKVKRLPVILAEGDHKNATLLGALYYVDTLNLANKALSETALEEHS